MAEMNVELVAVEREIWSGTATALFAETTVGELGVLPGHIPLLGELVEDGVVRIDTTDGQSITAAVFGGFLSVSEEKVTVLAEGAELADEIDVAAAREQLSAADSEEDAEWGDTLRKRAIARIKAAGETV